MDWNGGMTLFILVSESKAEIAASSLHEELSYEIADKDSSEDEVNCERLACGSRASVVEDAVVEGNFHCLQWRRETFRCTFEATDDVIQTR